MRIKQKVLVNFQFLFTALECARLTIDENLQRLDTCGAQKLETPGENKNGLPFEMDFPKDAWLVKVALEYNPYDFTENGTPFAINGMNHFALGSFISKRHILTSSQPVINETGNWLWNEEPITKYVIDGTRHIQVPLDTMNISLYVTMNTAIDTNPHDLPAVKNAWVLRVEGQHDIKEMRSPMIIELVKDHSVNEACLADSQSLNGADKLQIYGFGEKTENRSVLFHREKPLDHLDNDEARWIVVKRYYAKWDRGGPMVRLINKTSYILGVGASPGHNNNAEFTYFFAVLDLLDDICHFSGVCKKESSLTTTMIPPTAASLASSITNNSATGSLSVSTTPSSLPSSNASSSFAPGQVTTTEEPSIECSEPEEERTLYLVLEDDGSRGSGSIWALVAFLIVKFGF